MKQPLDIPVFICANGPSIDYSFLLLKKIGIKVFNFLWYGVKSFMSAYIYPDVHVEVERTEIVSRYT